MEYYISVLTKNNNFFNFLSLISRIPLKNKYDLNHVNDYNCLGLICDQKSYSSLNLTNIHTDKPIINLLNISNNYDNYWNIFNVFSPIEDTSYKDLFKLGNNIYFSIEKLSIITKNNIFLLSNLEFRLLYCLIKNKNKPCSVEFLLNKLELMSYSSVYVCIKKLRHKIEENPDSPLILVYKKGKGYYLKI